MMTGDGDPKKIVTAAFVVTHQRAFVVTHQRAYTAPFPFPSAPPSPPAGTQGRRCPRLRNPA